jgi:hypothetical protein
MARFVANSSFRPRFDNAVGAALADLVGILIDVFKDAFDEIAYYWDRPTLRKSGELAGSPRSNVDTGELRDSITQRKISKLGYEIAWIKPYAILSYLGGINRSDGTVTPPKPWIEVGLSIVEVDRLFANLLKSKLR